jgi:hypothetical protein
MERLGTHRPIQYDGRPMKLPQLSLPDLFWLVALVAMGCGWWADHARLSAELQALQFEQLIHLIQTTIVPESSTL